jgi:transglutaminase-like putative cysteine protease
VVHDDRLGVDPLVLSVLAGTSALLAGGAGQVVLVPFEVSPPVGFAVGVAVALVVTVAFRSVSLASSARTFVVIGAVAQIRLATLGESVLSGSQGTLAWVVAACLVLVLADRVASGAVEPMRGWTPPPDRARLVRAVTATTLAVVAVVLVVAPLLLPHVSRAARAGEGPRLQSQAEGGLNIRATDTLDMTTRPDLSDEVVFTVDADRGTFWRGQTYDRWDGRRWTQTTPRRFPLVGGDEVVHGPDDVGVTGGEVVTQRFRMEVTYSEVVFAAASAVRVESPRALLQGADATLVTAAEPLGRGTTYTVVSRRHALDDATLRAATGPVPAAIEERYAQPPTASPRVLDAALAATEGATTTYDKVRALERWMGERTEYSLDAPLSPVGVDVVDHFLFETRLGWCEQVASSLVVMARANGLPARLVTGFVPGEVDRLTGTYVVRAEHAHAWTEVWFPDLGWVAFDPTASVPLAGADQADRSLGRWILDHLLALVLGVGALALLAWGVAVLVRRRRADHADRPVGWVAEADARLGAVGERVGWPRAPSETATTYAASLGRRLRDPGAAEVGSVIDLALYAPVEPDAEARARVEQVLDRLDAVDPDASPAPPRSVAVDADA